MQRLDFRRAGAGPAAPPGPVLGGFGEFQLVLGERRIRWGNLQDEIGVLELWMGLVGLARL